ncbi:MAG: CBS domain-containing protein, partial [Desulfomonilaceae bacterium]
MTDYLKAYTVLPKVAVQFLERFSPFNELGTSMIHEIVGDLDVGFYPKGTLIFKSQITDVTHLHIIQKGSVRVFVRNSGDSFTLKSISGEGETLGGEWLLANQKPDVNVEAMEDTFCFLMPCSLFVKLVTEQTSFQQFFRNGFQKQRVSKAYSETRNQRIRTMRLSSFDYFTIRVSDIIRPKFQVINSNSTIQQLAQTMVKFDVSSVLVADNSKNIVGIVTKKDLRSKVVASNLEYDLPVKSIMSTPIKTIPVQARLFDAALRMVREVINHLAVTEGDEIVGILAKPDIMVHQITSPTIILRDIKSGETPEAINSLTRNTPGVIRSLMEEGAKASHCINVITLLYDAIFIRAMELAARFTDSDLSKRGFVLLGRAARTEQTFAPVYDYLLAYTHDQITYIDNHGEGSLENVISKLNDFFTSCLGATPRLKISAANPRWLQPIDVWSKYIGEWTSNPIPPEIAIAKNFLDMRPIPRENSTARTLEKMMFDGITSSKSFLKGLADDFLNTTPPVSFFRNTIVQADGSQSHRLDLESQVAEPFADFARIMSFKQKITETNTLARLKALARAGIIGVDLCA